MGEYDKAHELESEATDNRPSDEEFPTEPFPCPACGQLLAPACRVCVACKHPINPAEIARPQEVVSSAGPRQGTEPRTERVRFSWPIFFAVLGVSCFLALIFQGL